MQDNNLLIYVATVTLKFSFMPRLCEVLTRSALLKIRKNQTRFMEADADKAF